MATLYFKGGNWQTLSNWASNSGLTVPAAALPTSADDVISSVSISTNTGNIPTVANLTMNGSSTTLSIPIIVTSNVTFNNGSYNGNTITGNATFNGSSFNGNTITGNVTFNNTSRNSGTIIGNVTFNDSSFNNNIITGDATFNGSSRNAWIVNGNPTFNDSSFNNSTINGNATFTASTYGRNPVGTVSGTVTFNSLTPVAFVISSNNWSGSSSGWIFSTTGANWTFNNTSRNSGTIAGNVTFNNTSRNSDTIIGNVTFNDSSFNNNIITGDATFNGSSRNAWIVNGNPTFNDSSFNNSTITGNATFNNDSFNNSTINGNATFTASTYGRNPVGTVSGTVTFNSLTPVAFVISSNKWSGSSSGWIFSTTGANWTFNNPDTNGCWNEGTITGNVTFNNTSLNLGTITGNTTFNDSSYNAGTVNGTVNYNGLTGTNSYGAFLGGKKTSTIGIPITVTGSAVFTNDSILANNPSIPGFSGSITGNVIFRKNARNLSSISGSVTLDYDKGINGSSILGVV